MAVIGVDEMLLALQKGYLGGKYDQPKTLKMTQEMDEAIDIASKSNGIDSTEWLREVIAEALVKEDLRYERSVKARQSKSFLSNTLVDHGKEKA